VPERPLFVIGDIHGRLDLLRRAVAQIAEAAEFFGPGAPHDLLCIGDYVDRGEDSAGVLRHLHQAQQGRAADQGLICMLGNHEIMLLDFLDTPEEAGRRWLRHGGLQTLGSFGVGGLTEQAPPKAFWAARAALAEAMGPELIDWLKALPTLWRSGDLIAAHAGISPEKPPEDQSQTALLWGHKGFRSTPRGDGLWVVHGHWITNAPEIHRWPGGGGRIATDTGAYATGRLSVACIAGGQVRFL
jgi:serine/threonine protein phosphatase 1